MSLIVDEVIVRDHLACELVVAALQREQRRQDRAFDEEVDSLYYSIQLELIDLMRQNPDNVEPGTYLLWAAHNVERIADRATNIAERVVFQATGKLVRVGGDDDDAEAPSAG